MNLTFGVVPLCFFGVSCVVRRSSSVWLIERFDDRRGNVFEWAFGEAFLTLPLQFDEFLFTSQKL